MATCNLEHLPKTANEGDEVCDKYGNRWRYDAEQDTWISAGQLEILPEVTEDANGLVSPEEVARLIQLRQATANNPQFLAPLKLLPGTDAYWYYWRSPDKLVRMRPEGESALRMEVDKGRLFQILMKNICPGDRGPIGDAGDAGTAGRPGPDEVCFEPNLDGNRLDFSIFTPTPLTLGQTEIPLPGDHVPEIAVRVFRVTLATTQVAKRSVLRQKSLPKSTAELQIHDQLQYLAIYYQQFSGMSQFQRLRDLFIKQSFGTLQTACGALSHVLVFPVGTEVQDEPVVTVFVDPTGQSVPRVEWASTHQVDVNRTVESIQFDPTTNVVCGSIYLLESEWDETYCVKSRQRGPDGKRGEAGDTKVKITECTLDNTNVIATCPIINVRLDCDSETLFTFCSDLLSEICVESIKLPGSVGILSDQDALSATFASVQTTVNDCKLIYRYNVALEEDTFDALLLQHWDPQPGCVTKRHYNRHKFDWMTESNIGICQNLAKWYNPNLAPRQARYPYQIRVGKAPEQDTCCQEDFFYCPNIQEGGCPSS